MVITNKDFELAAGIVRGFYDDAAKEGMPEELATMLRGQAVAVRFAFTMFFKANSSEFDEYRFLNACLAIKTEE
jgi:hypothetical protein